MLTVHCSKWVFCSLPLTVLKVKDGKEPKIAVLLPQKTNVTEPSTHISGSWGRFRVWKYRLERVILQQPNTSTTADPGTRRAKAEGFSWSEEF